MKLLQLGAWWTCHCCFCRCHRIAMARCILTALRCICAPALLPLVPASACCPACCCWCVTPQCFSWDACVLQGHLHRSASLAIQRQHRANPQVIAAVVVFGSTNRSVCAWLLHEAAVSVKVVACPALVTASLCILCHLPSPLPACLLPCLPAAMLWRCPKLSCIQFQRQHRATLRLYIVAGVFLSYYEASAIRRMVDMPLLFL